MDRRTFSRRFATVLAATPALKSTAFAAAQPLPPANLTIDGSASQGISSSGSMDLGLNASLRGSRLFASSSWYQDVSGLPVHANSSTYLTTLGSQIYSQDAGGWSYNGSLVGIPYFVVDSSTQAFVPVVCQQYFDSCDLTYAPIPLRDDIIEGYPGNPVYPVTPNPDVDRHLVVVDRNKRVAYELYKAYRRNDHWYCSNIAVWDLDAAELQRPYGNTSVDVAGLSVMAGLLLGHQVTGNSIDHALRFTIQHQCPNFISPPAAHASSYGNANALPFGGRVRLKASVSESATPSGAPWNANALHIVKALKKYGMINADTGLALSSQGDTSTWDAGSGTGGPAWQQLRELTTSHFEVVNTGAAQYSVSSSFSGNAPTVSLTTSVPEVAVGQSVTLSPSWTGKALALLTPVGHAMKVPATVAHSPIRDTWYQLEVANPYKRVRVIKRVVVTDGAHRYSAYDRYIAPSGSLSNDGATPSTPWPINVLVSADKRHLIAGFVIGLLDGTYDMSGLSSVDYDYPLIDIPTGTFGKPTVLQAVNRRQAVLSGGANTRPLLGSRFQGLSVMQLIGLRFSTPSAGYSVYFSGDGAILIDDCEFSGFQSAAVRMSGVAAPFLRANTAHNTSASSLARFGGCTDVKVRGTVLDVSGRIWEEYGGANAGVVVD